MRLNGTGWEGRAGERIGRVELGGVGMGGHGVVRRSADDRGAEGRGARVGRYMSRGQEMRLLVYLANGHVDFSRSKSNLS